MQRAVAGVVRRTLEHAVEVLDDDRHTAERSVGKIAGCRGARAFEQRVDDGVELAVQLLDARDRGVDELDRRRVAVANQVGLGSRVEM